MHLVWDNTGVRFAQLIPDKLKVPAGALLVVAVFLAGSFASPESQDNTRANRAVSLFGLAVFIAVLWATSRDRKMVKWHTVIVGMFTQFIIALFVLRTKAGCMYNPNQDSGTNMEIRLMTVVKMISSALYLVWPGIFSALPIREPHF